jgi:hypothetical protein
MSQWLAIGHSSPHRWAEIVPINDLRQHEPGKDCWCSPDIEDEKDELIIIHNSLDEREKFETGQRKSS